MAGVIALFLFMGLERNGGLVVCDFSRLEGI